VLGAEVDVDGATGRATSIAVLNNPVVGFNDLVTTTSTQRLDWLGTLRGRIGWTPIERVLLYGTGGLAFGQSTSAFSVFDPLAGPPAINLFTSGNRHVGWTAGGGLEIALPGAWSNWSLKAEYLYYDLGTTAPTVFYQNIDLNGNPELSTLTGKYRHTGNIARGGLN
jgi:outer membrane immunogenic protein